MDVGNESPARLVLLVGAMGERVNSRQPGIAGILLLFSAIALGGCHALERSSSTQALLASNSSTASSTTPAGTSGRNPTIIQDILRTRCTSCHTESGKPENKINYI